MSLWMGSWEVIATDQAGKFTCRCVCGAEVVVERGALEESSFCPSCHHRPLVTQYQQDERVRAEQTRQFNFDFGRRQS
jgi:hypothetical protein